MTTENKEIDLKKIVEIVTPFDKFEYEPLLNEIQGNIIKSHGRDHAVYLFLKFKGKEGDPKAAMQAKQWIGSFSHRYVTSALDQAEQAKLYRENQDVPGKLFANFFLTRAGYMHLGYAYEELPNEDAFRQGMKDPNMQSELGDDSEQWENGFKNEIHALVLLAGDKIVGRRTQEIKKLDQMVKELLLKQPALLRKKVKAIKKELAAIAEVVHEQKGYVLRDENTYEEEIEHFGFRDGVSQPLFLKGDIDEERGKKEKFDKWDPSAPLNLLLFKDPLGDRDKESYGSFLVFRKLEQNVGGWNRDVVKVARKLNLVTDPPKAPLDPEGREPRLGQTLEDWMKEMFPKLEDPQQEKEQEKQRQKIKLAEAYTMGRFRDGTPTTLSENPQGHVENDFNYEKDSQGSKCPFFSHARKVNPRGDTGNADIVSTPTLLEEEKMHRIARRAINYGHLPSTVPEKDAGLLFMCFQASLASQFNFMQKAWAKEQNFVKRDVGTDVAIGVEKRDDDGRAPTEKYNWPTQWDSEEKTEVSFRHWVTMRGGEFFFAPSMNFLRKLAPEPSRNIVFRGVPKQEIEAAKKIIAELEEYKKKNWAIGLNGDTTQPDGFLTFFNQRKLPFKFYLLNQVRLGGYSAYDENIATLEKYIEDVINQESDACEYTIAEIEEYQDRHWAIGLNGDDPTKTDGFVNFFGERELPFKFYVRSKTGVSLGEKSAYAENIKTLEIYIGTLKPFRLVIKKNLKLLTVDGADTAENANIFVSPENGDDPSQLWLLEAAGDDDYYYLVAQHSGKVLSGQAKGRNVNQQQKNDSLQQQWKLEITGDGYYYLVAKKRSDDNLVQVLSAPGQESNVIQSIKSDSDDGQKWTIE